MKNELFTVDDGGDIRLVLAQDYPFYLELNFTKDSTIERIKQFLKLVFYGKAKFRLT